MDYHAALELAKTKNINILMKFTTAGCANCKRMEKHIFTPLAFTEFASKNLILVWLDYSVKYSKTPEEYLIRNDVLADIYGVRGYPECVYLESDGETIIGKLGNSGDATDFILRLRTLEAFTPKGQSLFVKEHPNHAEIFKEGLFKMKEFEKSLMDWLATAPAKSKENDLLHKKLTTNIDDSKLALIKVVESALK